MSHGVPCSGPDCDEKLQKNVPGVSTTEAPFWQLTRGDTGSDPTDVETLYFCSDECVKEFIDGNS